MKKFILADPEVRKNLTMCVIVGMRATSMHQSEAAEYIIELGCGYADATRPEGIFIERIETIKLTDAEIGNNIAIDAILSIATAKANKSGSLDN